jgi:hypothetical protein
VWADRGCGAWARHDSAFTRAFENLVVHDAVVRNKQAAADRYGISWRIVMSGPQNVSLDGVVQDPDGEEDFTLGGWFVQLGGTDLEAWSNVALDEALGAAACCWVGGATSSSGRGGAPGVAHWRTG